MTKSEVERELRAYLPAKRALQAARVNAAAATSDAVSLRAVVITGIPHPGGTADPVGRAIERMQQAVSKLTAAAERYATTMERVEQLIALADDVDGQTIIRLRFLEGVGFDFIPARVNMCRRAVFYHHRRALEDISARAECLH